jgi:hypothetical protein
MSQFSYRGARSGSLLTGLIVVLLVETAAGRNPLPLDQRVSNEFQLSH